MLINHDDRTALIAPLVRMASLIDAAAYARALANVPAYGRLCLWQESTGTWLVALQRGTAETGAAGGGCLNASPWQHAEPPTGATDAVAGRRRQRYAPPVKKHMQRYWARRVSIMQRRTGSATGGRLRLLERITRSYGQRAAAKADGKGAR